LGTASPSMAVAPVEAVTYMRACMARAPQDTSHKRLLPTECPTHRTAPHMPRSLRSMRPRSHCALTLSHCHTACQPWEWYVKISPDLTWCKDCTSSSHNRHTWHVRTLDRPPSVPKCARPCRQPHPLLLLLAPSRLPSRLPSRPAILRQPSPLLLPVVASLVVRLATASEGGALRAYRGCCCQPQRVTVRSRPTVD